MNHQSLGRYPLISALITTLLSCALFALNAQAQTIEKPAGFPDKQVRLVVPFPAGSPPDILARLISPSLSARIGQTVVVDNRPGANGNIGTEHVANSPPDGYSYIVCGITCSTADVFYKNMRYDMRKDLLPVVNFGVFPLVLIVSSNSPFKTAKDLLEFLQKNPGTAYASYGRGGSPHIAAEQLSSIGKVSLTHIPFGSSDPVMDIASQRVPFMFIPSGTANAKKDIVRSLAVASAQREALLPDLPTMQEVGLKGFQMEAWNALWAPKGTPIDRLEYMNRQINAVLNEPEIRNKFNGAGMRIIGGTRAQLYEYYDQDNKRWHEVAKVRGIQPE
jgi:tripartite-type tricarboxylate transporter receptor subunit TctC